jgi:hypothetical protein
MNVGVRFKDMKSLAVSIGKPLEVVEKRIRGGTCLNETKAIAPAAKKKASLEDALKMMYSPYPSSTPQVKLYQALVKKYGVFWSGGQVAYELKNIVPGRKYEADIALPNYKMVIEMDGYRHHGLSKSGFKRDREKWLFLSESGWLVIPVSLEQLNDHIADVLVSIENCLQQRTYQPISVVMLDKIIGCKLIR